MLSRLVLKSYELLGAKRGDTVVERDRADQPWGEEGAVDACMAVVVQTYE